MLLKSTPFVMVSNMEKTLENLRKLKKQIKSLLNQTSLLADFIETLNLKFVLRSLFALSFCFSIGCSSLIIKTSLPLLEDQAIVMKKESDPELARLAIPAQLKMLEGFLQSEPDNLDLQLLLAESFCSYSFAFLEDADQKRAGSWYLRGKNYALRVLQNLTGNPDFSKGELKAWGNNLKNLDVTSLPALYWLTQCWGGWLTMNLHNPFAFADISRIEPALKKVLVLDPNFYYAGAHRGLGAFYGSRTKILGGNPEKAKVNFEKSLSLTKGRFLINSFLFAKTYAVQNQDRALFEKLLNEILEAPDDLFPEEQLANEVAKLKAKVLLDSMDDLF
jgi:hypothetical protein